MGNFPFDYDETQTWLAALGKNGDTRVRAITKTPSEGVPKSLKFAANRLQDPLFVEQLIRENRNVYAVVNQGGDEASEISECIALFAEHDDLPTQEGLMPPLTAQSTPEEYAAYAAKNRELSWKLVRRLVTENSLPKPTMCVDTGGKSLQWFWRLNNPIQDKAAWTVLQKRLIQLLKSDISIIDAPRLMRLPGFPHASTGNLCVVKKIWSDLDENFDIRYELSDPEHFDHLLPDLNEAQDLYAGDEDLNVKTTKTQATEWFSLLNEGEQFACMAEMLAHVWRDTADTDTSHNDRLAFVAGLTHYVGTPDKMRNLWEMACEKSSDITWDKTTKTDMWTWAKEILKRGTGKNRSIGSAIRSAYKHGWVGRRWKARLANNEDHLQQMVYTELFQSGEGWLTSLERVYYKVDTHYELQTDVSLTRKISDFLAEAEEFRSKHTANNVEAILKNLKQRTGRDISANPQGYINCTNGILKINKNRQYKLIPHDSPEGLSLVFFDAPRFAYDPNADRTHAERLLECLDEDAKELFLRAMSFPLNWVDAAGGHGHGIALFSVGEGSNGKDTNADVLTRIYGEGAIGRVDLKEFWKQDRERSFEIYGLRHCKLNLPSETPSNMKVDHLKALKAAITGNVIKGEEKFADAIAFRPRLCMMFNTNDGVLLSNAQEADARRYMAIRWPYIFTKNEDKLRDTARYRRADTRFLGVSEADSNWIDEYVLPGYFNIMLDAFERVCDLGFTGLEDYSQGVVDSMGADINHFRDFIKSHAAEGAEYTKLNPTNKDWHPSSVSCDELFNVLYKPFCKEIGRAKETDDLFGGGLELTQVSQSSDKTCLTTADLKARMKTDIGITTMTPSAYYKDKYEQYLFPRNRTMIPKFALQDEYFQQILTYRKKHA